MRYALNCLLILGITGAIAGCGNNDGLLRTRGFVVRGDEGFVTPEGQHLQIQFVPIPKNGKPPNMYYAAEVNQDTGEFRPVGPMLKGMPPGKYRVALELLDEKKKDVFDGKFDTEQSPFVFDVEDETDEMIVDLDSPEAQSHMRASAMAAAASTGD
jgi:hypothetical protein